MKIRIAQLHVTQNIAENVQKIKAALDEAQSGEWVVFPEGMISGYYPEDAEYLKKLDSSQIDAVITDIKDMAVEKKVHVIVGTAYRESEQWYNVALLIDESGVKIYKKNNLSTLDRDHFTQGQDINSISEGGVILGIQMCRELVFPEQWRLLKQKGTQVIFHINNAIKEDDKKRESLLIARAFENQYWVCSVNNADPSQIMRSMVINPVGDIVWSSEPAIEMTAVFDIDLTQVQNIYLEQARTDLVIVVEQK